MDQSLLPFLRQHGSDVKTGIRVQTYCWLMMTSCTSPTKFPGYEEKWLLKLMTVILKITDRMGMVVFNSGVR